MKNRSLKDELSKEFKEREITMRDKPLCNNSNKRSQGTRSKRNQVTCVNFID